MYVEAVTFNIYQRSKDQYFFQITFQRLIFHASLHKVNLQKGNKKLRNIADSV